MTTLLCNEDAYLREFDAVVTGVTEKGVVLDRTAFYPGGGGQPSDAGGADDRDGGVCRQEAVAGGRANRP